VLRSAAASASARGAPETATSLLRRTLDEPPEPAVRAEVLLELGLVESQVDAAAGVARLREADATLADPATRLRLARPLAWGLIFTGHPQEAADRARAAAEAMPPEMDDLRRWLTAIELCSETFGAEVPGAPSRLAAERSTPPGGGPGARALQCYVSFDWCVRGGSVDEVAPLAAGALEGGVLLAEPDGFMPGAGALLALEMAERPEAGEAWDAAFSRAHRNGSLFAISTILLWRGLGLVWRGDMREARTHLEEAQAILARWGMASDTYPRIFLAELLTSIGALREARATLPAQSGWSERADASLFRLRAEAGLLLAEGRHAEALEACERLAGGLRIRGTAEVMNPAWIPWRSLTARALDGLGRRDEALDLLGAELARARTWGAPGPIGRTLRWIGEMERDDGRATLEEAAAVLEGSTARREHALALASLGAALRRARRPSDAREPLRRALELADACGADPPLVERVRTELAAAGARPRTTALSGPGALTPSERRAAAMAAEGMSNRGIAEALYVTPKTVELHLSSAYRKLGVRSRRELPEALAPS
jgi:DNA-binding CsgD family transcriptional regulator